MFAGVWSGEGAMPPDFSVDTNVKSLIKIACAVLSEIFYSLPLISADALNVLSMNQPINRFRFNRFHKRKNSSTNKYIYCCNGSINKELIVFRAWLRQFVCVSSSHIPTLNTNLKVQRNCTYRLTF